MSGYVAEGLAWCDGRLVPPAEASVSIADPSVQAGLGVFETMAVRGGRAVDLGAHLRRLRNAAGRVGVPLPEDPTLEAAAHEIARNVEGGYGWLKISALRSGRAVVFAGRLDPAEEGRSVTAVLLAWRQNANDPIAGLKTLNYASHILGLEEARRRGADEGIWRNTRGHLAEGCTSTLFVVRGRTIFTPSISEGILPGITREFVLEAARNLGIRLHEGKVRLEKLEKATEAFLSSSLRGIRPLVAFEGRPVGKGAPGPITRAVAREVARLRGIDPGPAGALESSTPSRSTGGRREEGEPRP